MLYEIIKYLKNKTIVFNKIYFVHLINNKNDNEWVWNEKINKVKNYIIKYSLKCVK